MIREVRELIPNEAALLLSPYSQSWPHFNYANADWQAPVPSLWPILSGERGAAIAVRWILPALEAGVVVLVPIDESNSAVPQLMQHDAFRTAWEEYSEVARGAYYRVFERP